MKCTFLLALTFFLFAACTQQADSNPPAVDEREPIVIRGDSLELDTDYSPPPGDPLSHHASGFAKILCSAVFISGLDFDFAAENIGYFAAPYEERSRFASREVDIENKAVHVTLPNGIVRTAKYFGDQGCICLAEGKDELSFTPTTIAKNLPDATSTPWPMGDGDDGKEFPSNVDEEKVQAAVEAAFTNPEGMTAGFIVTYKGQIIGEKYKDGITKDTPLESWSMGKSLTATLMGVLIQQGVYELYQNAPIPEWQEDPNDPRANIRIADILRMSSGLRFRAPQDPDFEPDQGYPDHLYVYTTGENSFQWSATRPQQWEPNTVGRYRNCDPSLTNYMIRLGVEGRGDEYLQFPQTHLFDRIGVRNMVMETDTYGNLLLQGYEFGTPRDWARLGNLYLNDGVWNDERILPEGFVEFVSNVAPAWNADDRNIYGGFFWINGDGDFPVPKDAYFMAGAGGQFTIMIPSHDLVVVKLSHYKGSRISGEDLNNALEILMEAIPASS